jgi:hypothetical protein
MIRKALPGEHDAAAEFIKQCEETKKPNSIEKLARVQWLIG